MDSLGDRMKIYERQETGRKFSKLLPIYARIDGRSFSRFTRDMKRPFDLRLTYAMVATTRHLVAETRAAIGYTQSDEINLVWDQPEYESEVFFDGKIQKMVSVLAGMATAAFNLECYMGPLIEYAQQMTPHFDCRVFQLPNRIEATNAILWREQDAAKNAVTMAARTFFTHGELQGKSGPEMQEMMWQKGQNFNDYPAYFRRGVFVRRVFITRPLNDEERARIPVQYQPNFIERSDIVTVDMPIFSKVTNREAVIFEGADPIVSLAPEPTLDHGQS